jgi:hypothetical protein
MSITLKRLMWAGLVAAMMAAAGPNSTARAQDAQPMMKVDFIVPASGYVEGTRTIPGDLCVMLPEEATTVTVSRRAFVPEAGTDRPLRMTIRPYISTAYPLVENINIQEPVSLTLPGLGYETCFEFENSLSARQAQGVAQAYKYYAQIATIEVR